MGRERGWRNTSLSNISLSSRHPRWQQEGGWGGQQRHSSAWCVSEGVPPRQPGFLGLKAGMSVYTSFIAWHFTASVFRAINKGKATVKL